MNPFIPELIFPVEATAGPVTTNGGVTGDNISLKDALNVWVVCHLKQAVGHATAITLKKGTVVATCVTALGVNVPIWYGNVSTSSDALARQTDAAAFTLDVGVTGDVIVVFQVDPAQLGEYGCLGVAVADSSQATNLISVLYFIQPRYAGLSRNYLTD